MNRVGIIIIKHLTRGISDVQTLMDITNVKAWQINSQLKDLVRRGFVTREGNVVMLKDESKSVSLRELTKKINIEKILHGANEIIFAHLAKPTSVNALVLKTGLSPATVYKAVSDFESVGAISRTGNMITVNKTSEYLMILANSLNIEQKNTHEPGVEILFKDSTKILKKTGKNKINEGELTGFSMFTELGVNYNVNHNYYIKQEKSLDIQDVLIHAVFAAQQNLDKHGMTIAIIFYLTHKPEMDVLNLRKIASSFRITDVWLDVEGYVRNNELKNPNLFLPKDEFIEKAILYEVPSNMYVLPEEYPKLFEDIGKNLPKKTRVYIIGDENMRIKGLKARTKDVDIVVENEKEFNLIKEALKKLGYKSKNRFKFSKEDFRIHPSIIMDHTNRSRVDLFTKKILKTLSLSSKMMSRAKQIDFGNLRLGILRNEDVFLLKSVTNREGDIQDMIAIINANPANNDQFQQNDFDWNIVWNEIIDQGKSSELQGFCIDTLDSIKWLIEQTGQAIPIRNKLQRLVLDLQIKKILREGMISIKMIVDLLVDEDISEQTVRNRIDVLVKSGIIKKESRNNEKNISFLNDLVYPNSTLTITPNNLEKYLQWRFPIREAPTPLGLEQIADELTYLNFKTIGEIDKVASRMLDELHTYEKTYYQNNIGNYIKNRLKQADAIRICMGLYDPKFGQNGT